MVGERFWWWGRVGGVLGFRARVCWAQGLGRRTQS